MWTTESQKKSGYIWAIPKDRDSWLDCTPEIVYVYFDGKWSVIRPGYEKHYHFEDFSHWGQYFIPPELPDEISNE